MYETSKSRIHWGALENSILKGQGLDIGSGSDPVLPEVKTFELIDGDANHISSYISEQFDFVYSSHCLEHMHDPQAALLEWFKLVRPGGHMFFIVPDEDLYEQGVFPSRFNPDHKATFTISKAHSWSPRSYNVFDLARSLPRAELVKLSLVDFGYDRSLFKFGRPNLALWKKFLFKSYNSIFFKKIRLIENWIGGILAVDQTRNTHISAQIECIVKKTP